MGLTYKDIERILYPLILRDRPGKRDAWIARGFKKIHAHEDRFVRYWEKRIAEDPESARLADEVHTGFLQRLKEPAPKAPQTGVQPPSLSTMASTFASSMARWVKNGFQVVSDEVLRSRLEICASCPLWDSKAFGGTGRCLKCGCSTQAKLRLSHESCPEGKWGPHTLTPPQQ